MTTPARIVTTHIYPPIPVRDHDWLACYDGREESRQYGWGCTEQEAIDDLVENYPTCPACGAVTDGGVGTDDCCFFCKAD